MLELELAANQAMIAEGVRGAEYQISMHYKLMDDVLREVADLRPKLGEIIGGSALDLIFGAFPVPGLNTALTAIRELEKFQSFRQSWIAAFLRLRQIEDA